MSDVLHFLEQHMFSCSFKSTLGIECPGCGTQRAFIALLRGDLMESFRLNASLIPFMFTIAFCISHLFFKFREGARVIVYAFGFTVVVMLVNFVIKLLSAG